MSTPLQILPLLPTPDALIALQPEELAGVILELIPRRDGFIEQNDVFWPYDNHQLNGEPKDPDWHRGKRDIVRLAIAEAWAWLEHEGLLVPARDREPRSGSYVLTRRCRDIKTRDDLSAYRQAGTLPEGLLHSRHAGTTRSLYRGGHYDTAVFQAFKEVEVAVRRKAMLPDSLIGVDLMRKAFNKDGGPLSDMTLEPGERQAESDLFAGAIGHGKNPNSHRERETTRQEAARLIVLASHLLDVVDRRSPPPFK